MDEHQRVWLIIVGAAVITYLLRAAPVLVFARRGVRTTGRVFCFLEYASYAIIGSLISGAAVSRTTLLAPSPAAVRHAAIALAVIVLTFVLAIRIRQPIICLGCGLALFLALTLLGRLFW